MRRYRIVLIVVASFLVLGALGGGAAFFLSRGAVTAADDFLAAIAHDGPEAAYAQAAPAFRSNGTAAQFAQTAGRLGLRGFRSANWASRSVTGDGAQLEGTVSLGDGGTIPVTVKLVKDDGGAWRVMQLTTPQPGLVTTSPAASGAAAPDAEQARQLAQVTLMQLAEAIHARDFRGLWAASASGVREQFTAETLADHFKAATDAHLDLTRAALRPFALHEPPRMENSVLVVKGVLPADDRPYDFEFGYVAEAGGWLPVSYSLSSHAPGG